MALTLKEADGGAPVDSLGFLKGLETDLTQFDGQAKALLEGKPLGGLSVSFTELVCD